MGETDIPEPLTGEEERSQRIHALHDAIAAQEWTHDLDVMEGADIDPLVTMVLTGDSIHEGLRSLFSRYDAEILDAELDDEHGTLALTVTVEAPWQKEGVRKIRSTTTSQTVTLIPEIMERAGFDMDTELEEQARDGEVLLTEYK